jgi:hypothetical protein
MLNQTVLEELNSQSVDCNHVDSKEEDKVP